MSPPVAGISAFVILLTILIFIFFVLGGSDKQSSTKPSASSSAEGESSGTGEFANFAGNYEMTEGLDDPSGADVLYLAPGAYSITPSGGTFTLEINDSGAVTGGSYVAHIDAVDTDDERDCSFAFESSGVRGSLSKSGAGAIGEVRIKGTLSSGGACTGAPYVTGVVRNVGITEKTMVVCSTAVAPSLQSCTAPQTRRAAILERQTEG